jgi:hypothetical protein
MANKTHIFSFLGEPPYKLLFVESHPQGGSCDYCSTFIKNFFWLESSDKKRFKVGCDCVLKSGDKGLINAVKAQKSKLNAEKRYLKQLNDTKRLFSLKEERSAQFSLLPHPNEFLAKKGKTLLDWWNYRINATSASKYRNLIKELESIPVASSDEKSEFLAKKQEMAKLRENEEKSKKEEFAKFLKIRDKMAKSLVNAKVTKKVVKSYAKINAEYVAITVEDPYLGKVWLKGSSKMFRDEIEVGNRITIPKIIITGESEDRSVLFAKAGTRKIIVSKED